MRGFTTIWYEGGILDGMCHENFPTRFSGKPIEARRETVVVSVPEGVEIWKVPEGKLPENWLCYRTDLYEKSGIKPLDQGVVYTFAETILVDRCTATTLKGKKCSNPAEPGGEECSTHLKRNRPDCTQ